MRILFVANLLRKHLDLFHLPYIKQLIHEGNILDIMAKNDHTDLKELEKYNILNINKIYDINFSRDIFSLKHIIIFFKLKDFFLKNKYDLIITNTPIPSALVRIAIPKKTNTKVIYFAHGFHFFKGSNLISKLTYLPLEYFLSKKTSLIITINKQDFELAEKKFCCKVVKVNGVGFKESFYDLTGLKKETNDKIQIISVGELTDRKNHIDVLKVLRSLNNTKYHYTICGDGKKESFLKKYIEKHSINCTLLGHVNDVKKHIFLADIFILPSKHEGLPVALMEAMALGKLCIVSNVRGNSDLINEGNGYLYQSLKQLSSVLKSSTYAFNTTSILRQKAFEDSHMYSLKYVFNQIMDLYRLL
jgi:glycosyltransferase involved in cell wall biosynthesis